MVPARDDNVHCSRVGTHKKQVQDFIGRNSGESWAKKDIDSNREIRRNLGKQGGKKGGRPRKKKKNDSSFASGDISENQPRRGERVPIFILSPLRGLCGVVSVSRGSSSVKRRRAPSDTPACGLSPLWGFKCVI